ncbi:TRAP transporter substrate-binding protein [Oricola sp.]|uniref:TRAP transporter substrate-binding protein n=1 Tax=Oricola sp. TaxID=1979950 RepID=UPI0025E3C4F7|nr:TRAP transporter substrate-binding protein [Oricola sp.]MCI5073852.1 TRAP transporter substrate-binding protein [Oricola sp.]
MKRILMAAVASCALMTGATQAAEVELALSHWVPATHPLQPSGMEPWAESIKEASGGRIEITIYPSQQLGAAPDHYDMARDGIVDIGFINPGYQPGRFPIIAAAELPFHISNAKGGSRAVHEWYQQYAEQEMSDVYVCLVHLHDPGTLHGKTGPLAVPADFAGKNIRPAHGTLARAVNLMGGASVQVPAPAMREALAKGTADVTASPWGSLFVFGAQDLVTHHLDIPLYVTSFAFVMNKAKIDGLAPEDRKVIDDHCTPEWSEKMASGWADAEASGRQKIADMEGHTLYAPDDAQLALWKETMAPLTGEWKASAAEAGIDADAAYDSLVETLKKYDAYVE